MRFSCGYHSSYETTYTVRLIKTKQMERTIVNQDCGAHAIRNEKDSYIFLYKKTHYSTEQWIL